MNNTSMSEFEDRDSSVCVQQMAEDDTRKKSDLYDVLLHALNTGDTRIFTRLSQQETLERFEQIDTLYLDLDGTSLEQGATEFPPGFIDKMRKLQHANTRIVFVTGKPETEIRALMNTVPVDVPLSFIFERAGYRIVRTEGQDPQCTQLLANGHTEAVARALKHEMYNGIGQQLEKRYGVRIVPAGDGGHRSVVSIDILRGDAPVDYQSYPRYDLKVSDREQLAAVRADMEMFLRERFASWSLTDLGNGNFEIHHSDQTKERGILRTPEFGQSKGYRMAIDDSPNGMTMLRLKHSQERMMAGVVFNRHTPTELVALADVAIAGEATADLLLQQVMDAKGIDERVFVISNTPPYQKKGGAMVTSIGAPVAIAQAVDGAPHSRWLFPSKDPDLYRDTAPMAGQEQLYRKLVPVRITPEKHVSQYGEIANKGFWKASHPDAFPEVPTFPERDWDNYLHVNRNIAREVADNLNGIKDPTIIWVHDFQVAALAMELRNIYDRQKLKMGFFWHIPFAQPDIFIKRLMEGEGDTRRVKQLLTWLSCYDVLGFHTQEYADNYQETCRILGVRGGNAVVENVHKAVVARAVVQPISIDVQDAEIKARAVMCDPDFVFENPVLNQLFTDIKQNKQEIDVVLNGLERADPIKGSKPRLQALFDLAAEEPELFERKIIIEGLSESRTATDPLYEQYYNDCRRLIEQINDRLDHTEVVKQIQSISRREDVIGLIAKSRYAMVTSVADGYNMVGPETLVTWHATRDCVQRPRMMFMSDRTGFVKSLHENGFDGAVPVVHGPITRTSLKKPISDLLSGRTPEPDYEKISAYFATFTIQQWVRRHIQETRFSGFERIQEIAPHYASSQ